MAGSVATPNPFTARKDSSRSLWLYQRETVEPIPLGTEANAESIAK